MLMLKGNALFTLLGSLSLVLVAEAFWGVEWSDIDWNTQEEPVEPPQPEETVIQEGHLHKHKYQPEPVHKYQPEPIIVPVPEPIVEPFNPVKVETVVVLEDVEQLAHSIEQVPFDIRMIKYMSTTETVTFTSTSFFRSTVITTPIIYKTDTMLVNTIAFVTGIKTSLAYTTHTETEVLVDTVTKTQTIYKDVSTPVTMTLTVEDQTTKTEYHPYTLTTTNRKVVTDWTTVKVDLASEQHVTIPVVNIETVSITIPFTKTITDWITLTETTTECEW